MRDEPAGFALWPLVPSPDPHSPDVRGVVERAGSPDGHPAHSNHLEGGAEGGALGGPLWPFLDPLGGSLLPTPIPFHLPALLRRGSALRPNKERGHGNTGFCHLTFAGAFPIVIFGGTPWTAAERS